MGHVEDAHEAVLEIQPHGHQRIDAARDDAGDDQLDPEPHGERALAGAAPREARAYFHAGLGMDSFAVARLAGHTTSKSPPTH